MESNSASAQDRAGRSGEKNKMSLSSVPYVYAMHVHYSMCYSRAIVAFGTNLNLSLNFSAQFIFLYFPFLSFPFLFLLLTSQEACSAAAWWLIYHVLY